eukprot:1159717-Pelagomonas_calceolata.AAC.3
MNRNRQQSSPGPCAALFRRPLMSTANSTASMASTKAVDVSLFEQLVRGQSGPALSSFPQQPRAASQKALPDFLTYEAFDGKSSPKETLGKGLACEIEAMGKEG